MARLRQQHPQDYGSSGKIHTDFENIVRYLNAAEKGDKTVGELISQLFNDDGEFEGPIEMRLNATTGLEYRIGSYRESEDGWQTLVAIEDIRGPSGQNLGMIEGPLLFNRKDIVADHITSTVNYDFDPAIEDILVYKNGILLRGIGVSPEYTFNTVAGTVTFATPLAINATATIYSVRAGAVSNYRRLDYIAVGTTATIAFPHTDQEKILVYKNGILQREGATNDYVRSAATSTITFLTPLVLSDVATAITVENQAQVNVAGLMLEDEYTDGYGFIKYAKISVEDEEIPQIKVANLSETLAAKAKISVASSTPTSPVSGDLWLDTSQSPNVLRFYQGTQWLSASPDNGLPSFTTGNANQYLRVNGVGTGYELGDIDDTALVPKTYMGAANGVAGLDSAGKLISTQLPEIFSIDTLDFFQEGAVTASTKFIKGLYKQKVRIDGISLVLGTGTCTAQLAVDGIAVGITYAVSTSRTNLTISPAIEIDATTFGRKLQVIITSPASTPTNLEISVSSATLSA